MTSAAAKNRVSLVWFAGDYLKSRFEPSEIKKRKAGAFVNLRHFNYFTHIKSNGRDFKVQFVKDFSAAIEKDRLVYEFFVPCHVSALDTFKEIQLSVYDHTFYCSIFWVDNPVAYQNHAPYAVEHRIAREKAEACYYGQIYPDKNHVEVQKQKWLER